MERYQATLRQLYGRHSRGIKLGLTPMRQLLAALGNPQHAMRHVVVAGTNGKGSTSRLIALALHEAGHRVGHYTSPHLLRFTERIRVGDMELAASDVPLLADRVLRAESTCERPPTFFELVTAMALVAFAEGGVQVAVLEVGMGGRLDATNVVSKLLAVITPIALDHQAFLGNTVAQIAYEKAGIIDTGGRVVVAPQHPEAQVVIDHVVAQRAATLWPSPAVARQGATLALAGTGFHPLVLGRWPEGSYQRQNLATAAAATRALDALGVRCPDHALSRAARSFVWPGRFQWLGFDDVPVLLDGAHNPAALTALRSALASESRAARPCHVVFTVLADRPAPEMLEAIRPLATSVHWCPVDSTRTRSPAELAALEHGSVHETCSAALVAARAAARADGGYVLVTGSLFLVADALAEITGEPRDPPIDG